MSSWQHLGSSTGIRQCNLPLHIHKRCLDFPDFGTCGPKSGVFARLRHAHVSAASSRGNLGDDAHFYQNLKSANVGVVEDEGFWHHRHLLRSIVGTCLFMSTLACPVHCLAATAPPNYSSGRTLTVDREWLEGLLMEEASLRIRQMSDTELLAEFDEMMRHSHGVAAIPNPVGEANKASTSRTFKGLPNQAAPPISDEGSRSPQQERNAYRPWSLGQLWGSRERRDPFPQASGAPDSILGPPSEAPEIPGLPAPAVTPSLAGPSRSPQKEDPLPAQQPNRRARLDAPPGVFQRDRDASVQPDGRAQGASVQPDERAQDASVQSDENRKAGADRDVPQQEQGSSLWPAEKDKLDPLGDTLQQSRGANTPLWPGQRARDGLMPDLSEEGRSVFSWPAQGVWRPGQVKETDPKAPGVSNEQKLGPEPDQAMQSGGGRDTSTPGAEVSRKGRKAFGEPDQATGSGGLDAAVRGAEREGTAAPDVAMRKDGRSEEGRELEMEASGLEDAEMDPAESWASTLAALEARLQDLAPSLPPLDDQGEAGNEQEGPLSLARQALEGVLGRLEPVWEALPDTTRNIFLGSGAGLIGVSALASGSKKQGSSKQTSAGLGLQEGPGGRVQPASARSRVPPPPPPVPLPGAPPRPFGATSSAQQTSSYFAGPQPPASRRSSNAEPTLSSAVQLDPSARRVPWGIRSGPPAVPQGSLPQGGAQGTGPAYRRPAPDSLPQLDGRGAPAADAGEGAGQMYRRPASQVGAWADERDAWEGDLFKTAGQRPWPGPGPEIWGGLAEMSPRGDGGRSGEGTTERSGNGAAGAKPRMIKIRRSGSSGGSREAGTAQERSRPPPVDPDQATGPVGGGRARNMGNEGGTAGGNSGGVLWVREEAPLEGVEVLVGEGLPAPGRGLGPNPDGLGPNRAGWGKTGSSENGREPSSRFGALGRLFGARESGAEEARAGSGTPGSNDGVLWVRESGPVEGPSPSPAGPAVWGRDERGGGGGAEPLPGGPGTNGAPGARLPSVPEQRHGGSGSAGAPTEGQSLAGRGLRNEEHQLHPRGFYGETGPHADAENGRDPGAAGEDHWRSSDFLWDNGDS
eukprot:jgi/Botrbrau1/8551/Bobra.0359s0015.1